MKTLNLRSWAVLAVLAAGGAVATAQQSKVPGPDQYNRFSAFIADRNIFDPARVPHSTGTRVRTYVRQRQRNRNAPAFAYVGAMFYSKGLFAFFDGNNDEFRQALQVNGKIAGYTVRKIGLTQVELEAGGKITELAVGNQLRYDNSDDTWQPAGESGGFEGQADSNVPSANSGSGEGGGSAVVAASPSVPAVVPAGASGGMSDVLKRLMLQRQQENK
jgi:hypothetical protein